MRGEPAQGVHARAVVPRRPHGAPVRDDGRRHGARHAGVRRSPGAGAHLDKAAPQPGEEGRRRDLGVRDEREPLVPLAPAPREPRHHGVPRRGADAEGGRDARDGLEPPDRLRPRLRAARGRPLARPPRRPAAERPGLRVGRLLRRDQVVGHHGLGRRDRHAREHVALREGQPERADDRAAPVQPAAARLAARTRATSAWSSCRRRWWRRRPSRRCSSTSARRARGSPRRSSAPTRASAAITSTSGRSAARPARRASPRCGRPGRSRACTSSRTAGRCRAGMPAFTESGTYAPTFRVGTWLDEAGDRHLFMMRRLRGVGRGRAVGEPRRRCSASTSRWCRSRRGSTCPTRRSRT